MVGFGDFVRLLASQAGKGTGRSDLQRLGQERIEQDTPYFVREFLKWAAPPTQRPLIIEGVRHKAVDLALRAWAISEDRDYSLILINTAAEERAVRRTNGNLASMRAIDHHLVERETAETLSRFANAVVDGSGDGAEVLARVVEALGDRWPAGG